MGHLEEGRHSLLPLSCRSLIAISLIHASVLDSALQTDTSTANSPTSWINQTCSRHHRHVDSSFGKLHPAKLTSPQPSLCTDGSPFLCAISGYHTQSSSVPLPRF
ncbi:hypothetical protein FB567DRAFT_261004 [Paraphoma chrysanthemicola]|uniref:Secreted protein n=1 Tax=Paraphoma chrysanthemicola TaxID=798071 RepID=A0A8K0VR66_9PLEO|nr:hypothetical protein FB567DRAFT_261004 [Paraphoma chrysanthemicola]